MQPIHANVQVSFRYDVHFTTDLFHPENVLLRDVVTALPETPVLPSADTVGRPNHVDGVMRAVNGLANGTPTNGTPAKVARIMFVVDESVERVLGLSHAIETYCEAHSDSISLICSPIALPGGEKIKNSPEYAECIQVAVNETGLDRHSYIVAIGGGALLDAVGYAAATAHRGIRLIRVPTTTLSQDDSGVGVKNAINAFGKKNFIGTFAPPYAVLNDFKFLESLPDREWRGGMSEAVKVALLKDKEFFEFLESCAPQLAARDMSAMQHLVRRSAELHVQHICTSGDAFEMGSSRPLDFGHWAAHKLEQITDYRLHHGEAVAIGLALDVTYSHLKGWLKESEWMRILQTFDTLGFELYSPHLSNHLDEPNHVDNVFRGLREFREHLGGELTIAMLRCIGQGFDVHEIDEDLMLQAMRLLEKTADEMKFAPAMVSLEVAV